ncbi:MAG: YciK family oxidoreductase [Gammaproteobacteria bacterium]|nr:YciK family oxidoreductase [Gammaproteobacteria bacterium]
MFQFNPPKDFLHNRYVLITGASDGIGKTCAETFAGYGANLILLGRSQEKLEKLFDRLDVLAPGRITIQPVDFATATTEDYKVLAEHLNAQTSVLHVLLHNAALLGTRTPIQYYPESDWETLMKVNVGSGFYLTKALLPLLLAADSARILFTSSSVGRKGRAWWGGYGVSKFAVEGLMQTLADEVGTTTSIKVNSINPGGTRTAMRQTAYPAENPASQPTPESLMPVYLYLLSEQAAAIHGKALDVRNFDPATV